MRKSEFIYNGDHADDQPLFLQDGDYVDFETLHPERGFHILPGPWISAFAKRTYKANHDNRQARLARTPKVPDGRPYLIRYKQDRRVSKDSAYTRHSNADALLNEKPHYKTDPFAHRVFEDLVQASIELGIRDAGFSITKWHELPKSKAVSEVLNKGRNPHLIETYYDRRYDKYHHLCPDGEPHRIDDGNDHLHYTKEIQLLTSRAKNKQKFLNYKWFFEHKKWRTYYDFTNFVVVFVAKNEEQKRMLMILCHEVYEGKCTHIGFTSWCDPWTDPQFPKPSGTIFTRDLERVGFSPVSLSRLWE